MRRTRIGSSLFISLIAGWTHAQLVADQPRAAEEDERSAVQVGTAPGAGADKVTMEAKTPRIPYLERSELENENVEALPPLQWLESIALRGIELPDSSKPSDCSDMVNYGDEGVQVTARVGMVGVIPFAEAKFNIKWQATPSLAGALGCVPRSTIDASAELMKRLDKVLSHEVPVSPQ